MIFDHVTHFQVFNSNQVVRLDRGPVPDPYAPCRFNGKIFTLPGDFQVLTAQPLPRFDTILAAFGFF